MSSVIGPIGVFVERRRGALRRFDQATGGEVNMQIGKPLAAVLGLKLDEDTASVRINGEWFIRPDSAELSRIKAIWRAAQ